MARAPRLPHLSLPRLFARFLRFGFLAWGGPVAQIAMLRRELVDEEGWVSSDRFNRTLAVYQVLPGPEAQELTVWFGYLARGRIGGFLAGLGFMLPGFVLVLALAWVYLSVDLTAGPLVAVFAGAQVAVMALIVRAVHRIGAHAVTDRWLAAIALTGFAASLAGIHFALVLASGGAAYAFVRRGWRGVAIVLLAGLLVASLVLLLLGPAAASPPDAVPSVVEGSVEAGPIDLLAAGLRAGLLSFGGAYSALPVIEADAVAGGWLDRAAILDGIALAGILPAPLIMFATFVGYVAGGLPGAVAITFGVFLPAFAFTLVGHRWLERVVEQTSAHAFLDGVTAGVVGLIAAVALRFAPTVLTSAAAVAVFGLALLALSRWTAGWVVAVVVIGGGLLGLLLAAGGSPL